MRTITPALYDAQKSSAIKPALIINVGDVAFRTAGSTVGNTTTCHNTNADELNWVRDEGGRILKVVDKENPYSHKTEITLNNYDRMLYDIVMKGKRLSIGWGAETYDGPVYSFTPALYVKEQTFIEAEGALRCVVNCVGMMDLLNEDAATSEYADDGTSTVGELITAVFEATLTPYSSCKAYNVVVDDDLDDLWDGVYLGDSFVIKKGDTRAYTLARLFDLTHAFFRAGNEATDEDGKDTFHIFTQSATVQHEFTLDRTGHRFYIAAESEGMITPNEIIIRTPTGQTPSYYGRAREAYSYNLNPCSRTEYVSGVISSAQAYSVANTLLSKIITSSSGSSAVVPIHCGLELFDRIKVISKRSGRELEGAIGGMIRTYDPMKKEPVYDLKISFGKWFDPRRLDDSLGYGYGYLGTDIDEENVSGNGHVYVGFNAPYEVSNAGHWVMFTYGCGPVIVAGVDGAWLTCKVKLDSGTWKLVYLGAVGTSAGILDILVDDVEIASEDFYGTPTTFMGTKYATFEVSGGEHIIKLLIDGKNESSAGYVMILSGCEIIKSSYSGTVI